LNEIEQKVWEQHDRRLNEHELRFNQGTKDFTEIKDALKQLTERINEGVSKTQQRILEENKTIEIAMHDLRHAVDLNTEKMNNKVDIVEDSLSKRVTKMEETNQKRDSIYIWAVVIGVVSGLAMWGTKTALDRFFSQKNTDDSYLEHVRGLTAKTAKGRE